MGPCHVRIPFSSSIVSSVGSSDIEVMLDVANWRGLRCCTFELFLGELGCVPSSPIPQEKCQCVVDAADLVQGIDVGRSCGVAVVQCGAEERNVAKTVL